MIHIHIFRTRSHGFNQIKKINSHHSKTSIAQGRGISNKDPPHSKINTILWDKNELDYHCSYPSISSSIQHCFYHKTSPQEQIVSLCRL